MGGELPLLPFGNPIGPSTLLRMVSLPFEGLRALSYIDGSNHFVPASRGGVNIESKDIAQNCFKPSELPKRPPEGFLPVPPASFSSSPPSVFPEAFAYG